MRVLAGTAGVLVLVIVVLAAFVVHSIRNSFPHTDGDLAVAGLNAGVTVKRDGSGIAQIYADDPHDLFFAQGFVHAQDRFFEMEFRRRLAAGRLAEVFGPGAVDTDRFIRTMGWRRVAEQEFALLKPETRAALQAYADGVNAWLSDRSGSELSLEFGLLELQGAGVRPEPWVPADSLAWLKVMAFDLGGNYADELTRLSLSASLSAGKIGQLFPAYPDERNAPIVRGGSIRDGRFSHLAPNGNGGPGGAGVGLSRATMAAVAPVAARLNALTAKLVGLHRNAGGIGSNSFVVAGSRTVSGKPLLANDPHLAPSMPGVWYQMGLHCRTVSAQCPYQVAGFTFSGLPGVVIGHNATVAWGFTNLNPDVQDLYVERLIGNGTAVTRNGATTTAPLTVRTEQIKVAGGDPVEITVRLSRHGPLISDVLPGSDPARAGSNLKGGPGSYALALKWTALSPGRTADAILALNTASNFTEFRKAAATFEVPSQNLIYADTSGNIGYQSPGRIPIRGRGDGRWPAPGWDADYDWTGWIPFAELPTVLNPKAGYIVTANQAVTGPGYPRLLTTGWDYGYRSQQIVSRIATMDRLDVESMATIQLDTVNRSAAFLAPYLQAITFTDPFIKQGQAALRGWDYRQPADSAAAAYYNCVWRQVLALTFHDDLPEDTWPDGDSRWFEVVRTLLTDPTNDFWDNAKTPQLETRDVVLRQAMINARAQITHLMARDVEHWEWGKLHTLTLVNQTLGTSGIGIVEKIFNRGPYRTGGGSSVVLANGWNPVAGYEVTAVPSMRMVADLSRLDNSRWINLTGVSGHAYHRNYVDQTELWLNGETLPWVFSREAVDRATQDTLILKPR